MTAAEGPASDQAATPTPPLKWFFLAMALGLALSTTLGVWIALALLLIGAAVPVLLILRPLPPRRF